MIYIVYFNFEELEKVLDIKSLKFVAHNWTKNFYIPTCTHINFKNLVYDGRNKNTFIHSLNETELRHKFNFKETYNQENSIILVNYKSELEYVKLHTNLDIVTIVLHTEDSDVKQYNADFLYLYNFGYCFDCKIPRIDNHIMITNFIKSNLYAV